ncbi:MAG TPA: glycosyltransferase family 4 protein [Nitrososphaerales archaeon]|nr:glycosyltransferase family 4 protein [Nitrososphaerales archaeon]
MTTLEDTRAKSHFNLVASSRDSVSATRPLRILMLTWEYPPRIIGGISRVVEGLSKALVKLGNEVHVVTTEMPGSPMEEVDEGVFVHRVAVSSPAPNFHSWILLMNHFFSKRVGALVAELGSFDIVHVHDWLVLPSGAEAKSFLQTKMVSTLHSLEFRRAGEVTSPEGRMIDSFEWWITYESSIIIVCSGSMKEDTKSRFKVPEAKIWVIPIGIDPSRFEKIRPDRDSVRAKYGVMPSEKLVLFVGRLTHQKGCEYLIRALPSVSKFHNVKLVIVGDGYQRGELEYASALTGEAWRIHFTGFLPDEEVADLLRSADVMVIPSVYEPFGVVALEAMVAGVPVVASDVDGLGEIIKHEHNGILVFPRDSSSISWGISRVLSDPLNSARLVENAKKDISAKYTWKAVASLTLEAYKKVLQ